MQVARAQAQLRGVPMQFVWNPVILSSPGGTGDQWSNPINMYPGDDVVDVHGVDIYSNNFYPQGFNNWTGYAGLAPFTLGQVPSGTSGNVTDWANFNSDYSNPSYYYDFTDSNGNNSDGTMANGWSMYKAFCYAQMIGMYAGGANAAINPDGSARVAKPLIIAECGVINSVSGNGPFGSSSNGLDYGDDPNFFNYLKSRIAWFQQQGGQLLLASLWTWPNGTQVGPTMAPTFASVWPVTVSG